MMTWLSVGMVFSLSMVVLVLFRWGGKTLTGERPVSLWVFVAILFTSGLDVGLIMFPLTEFPVYADIQNNPSYAFSNPLAIEFGFWGGLVWCLYFLTCFYFCAIEPKVGFFRIPLVRMVNNLVIIGTCAFTAFLLFSNLSWYWPTIPESVSPILFYALVTGVTVFLAVCSSTHLRFVTVLSVSSSVLFLILLLAMAVGISLSDVSSGILSGVPLMADYFPNIYRFALPFNAYHEFYLYWWFAWSIMIGQFTARFVGGITTRSLFVHMILWPSVSIALWFSVLYAYYQNQVSTDGVVNGAMLVVGLVFVLNSLDSLIRLYSDNLNLTAGRLGNGRYILLHFALMSSLCALFSLDFLKIQWVGALVVGLGIACAGYCVWYKRRQLPPAEPVLSLISSGQ